MFDPKSAENGVDLDALDAFLLSDRAPEGSMGLSDLDGFLTGIVVGPELVPPSEWLPVIWGSDKPRFADANEAQTILAAIMGRYNEIIANFGASPMRFSPVFLQGAEGHIIVTDWATGFLEAVNLRIENWNPLILHPEARSLIDPMFMIGLVDEDDLELEESQSPDEINRLLEHGEEFVTSCVLGIRAFWLEHGGEARSKAPQNRREPNSGRR